MTDMPSPQVNPPSQTPPPSRPAMMTPDDWAAQFTTQMGREPSMSEYQQAVASGVVGAPRDPSIQQMRDGVRQLAQGMGGFVSGRLGSPTAAPTRAEQSSTSGIGATLPTIRGVSSLMLILPAGALIAIIGLLMPVVTTPGGSFGWFSKDLDQSVTGVSLLMLVGCLACLACSAVIFSRRARSAVIVSIVVGALTGLLTAYSGFATASTMRDQLRGFSSYSVSVGFGPTLIGLMGLVILGGTVVSGLLLKQFTPAASPVSPATPVS